MTDVDLSNKPGGSHIRAQAGKYLTFRLAEEEYGLEILKVQEIIGLMAVTRVPKMPKYVRGIINLRGKLIPVIDMREKFLLPDVEDTEKTCVIVVQTQTKEEKLIMGIIVDTVSEVLNIGQNELEPPPSIGSKLDTEYMLGIGKVHNRVVILLDIDNVLCETELHLVSNIGDKNVGDKNVNDRKNNELLEETNKNEKKVVNG
ncbi:MAG: purine-binding chemotaxis protein CheW [Oligoflexia bacterium]|nr:purine-binding chemotaxis protein CheW [Oligoflexia bacterium]